MRRLVTALLLQGIGAPVVDERLDDALWQKAREALGASPASTIVHSHFSKWLDDRLDAAQAAGGARGTGQGRALRGVGSPVEAAQDVSLRRGCGEPGSPLVLLRL